MSDSASVTVFRTKDPVEGELVVDLLQQEGVEARLLGTRNAALIGAGANVFDLKIEVAPDDADEAREVIDAYLKGERAPLAATDAPDTPDRAGEPEPLEEPDDRESARRPLLAAGASLVVPGGGHFYARRPITGLLLVLGYVGGFAALINGHYVGSTCGTLVIVGLVIVDLVGGQRSVRAWNRGARAGVLRELGGGALLLAVVYGAALLIASHLPPPKPKSTYYDYGQ